MNKFVHPVPDGTIRLAASTLLRNPVLTMHPTAPRTLHLPPDIGAGYSLDMEFWVVNTGAYSLTVNEGARTPAVGSTTVPAHTSAHFLLSPTGEGYNLVRLA